MISKVFIRNFKCLRNVSIDLERFTVFVGPNASGKSTILQVLDLLCQTFQFAQPGQQFDGNFMPHLTRGATEPIEVAAESSGQAYRYRTRSPSAPALPMNAQWNGQGAGVAASLDSTEWQPWACQPAHSAPLPLSVLLRLESPKLKVPSLSPDPTKISADGTGLHTALANMALNDPDSWQALQDDLRHIIPTIRRLRHTKDAHAQPSLLFDTVGADSVFANQVSEGTLLVLGLLAVLYAPNRPNLILLDDLDRALHPTAQKELLALLRRVLDTNPQLQFLATSHSPYMLDWVSVNEVRMTMLTDDGATACAALTDHPRFQKWKDEMTPGEMWSLFGEKWLIREVSP